MTAATHTGTGDAERYPPRARHRGLPAGERGPARTAHSTLDALDGKAAP